MLVLPLQLETESRCINARHHFFSLHNRLLYAHSYRNIYIFILQDKNLTFHNQTYTMLMNPVLGAKTLNQGVQGSSPWRCMKSSRLVNIRV